jgi:hypothetical protein
MAMEKHGDPTTGRVLRTPSINKTPFVRALVTKGCSQETAERAAETVIQLAGMKRPPGFPVTTQITLGDTPYMVTADLKGDLLVLISISRIPTS